MAREKRSPTVKRSGRMVKTKAGLASVSPEMVLVPGPKLRRMLGVSAVTLWRWRDDEDMAFPVAKVINGRNYFPWADVQAWLTRQQKAA